MHYFHILNKTGAKLRSSEDQTEGKKHSKDVSNFAKDDVCWQQNSIREVDTGHQEGVGYTGNALCSDCTTNILERDYSQPLITPHRTAALTAPHKTVPNLPSSPARSDHSASLSLPHDVHPLPLPESP